ncbi:MAG: type II toxin-antitoxin system VapC family toxin [Actinobacteria bacterium]|nr:type II toxin-antitoxin system VapC family toxin [Actinomycetota bacterium]
MPSASSVDRLPIYFDSSALVKLVADEPESNALRDFVDGITERVVSSVIAVVEVRRAARRYEAEDRAVEVIEKLAKLQVRTAILESAAGLEPLALSSLDAIHLASALSIRTELDGFVVYDSRLAAAAASAGLRVLAPS